MHASAFLPWFVCFCLTACFLCSPSLLFFPSLLQILGACLGLLAPLSPFTLPPLPLSFVPSHSHRSRFLFSFVYHCFHLLTFSLPLSEPVAPPLDGVDCGAGGGSALTSSLLFTFLVVEMLGFEASLSSRISSSGSHFRHIDLCRARGSSPWAASHIASSPFCRASASTCSHVLSCLFLDSGERTHAHRFPFSSSCLPSASPAPVRAHAPASLSLALSLLSSLFASAHSAALLLFFLRRCASSRCRFLCSGVRLCATVLRFLSSLTR